MTPSNNDRLIQHLEVKSARQALPKQVALPPSYDAFFSFPVKKTGYSGVVTYTRTDVVTPSKAEEGLTGLIQPRPPLSPKERISPWDNYPPNLEEHIISEEVEFKEDHLDLDLDGEGRAILVDLGLFVLINVYCPNDSGTEGREKFKMDYHRLLETRVRTLVMREGREVIVVGDLNACASVEDHCEGHLMVARGLAEGLKGDEGFWGKEYRKWIRDWLVQDDGSGGCMVDIVRKFWPDRKKMYTCAFVCFFVRPCFSGQQSGRLEYQNLCTRNQLRYKGRLYSHYTRPCSLDQSSRHTTPCQRQ